SQRKTYTLSLHDALPIFNTIHATRRTRSEKELAKELSRRICRHLCADLCGRGFYHCDRRAEPGRDRPGAWARNRAHGRCCRSHRSEEHTSELQSLAYLVC